MELLIPGLMLVALMIYVSTKIKKNAALAYERETVETPEFSIIKPEGFICPVDHGEELLFAAYSKEYGRDHADGFRQVSAEIRMFTDADFDEVRERVKVDSVRIISENIGILNGGKSCVIEAERVEDGITLETFYKIIVSEGKVYQLTVAVLPEYKVDYAGKVEELLSSFTLK